MKAADGIPQRSGYGDIFALFFLVLSVALGLQAYGEVFQFAGLRSNGERIEGRWIDNYTDPTTSARMVIYSFEVDEQTYRNRQVIPAELAQGVGSGDPVTVVYLPENPDVSRLDGTFGYSKGYLVQFIVSLTFAVFSLQYLIARRLERGAWVFKLLAYVPSGNRDRYQMEAND